MSGGYTLLIPGGIDARATLVQRLIVATKSKMSNISAPISTFILHTRGIAPITLNEGAPMTVRQGSPIVAGNCYEKTVTKI